VAVVLAGMAGSVLVAQEWRSTVTRQRVERLDRTAASRTITITDAMANYENALQAARSLWLASTSVSRSEFNAFARSLDLKDRYTGSRASAGGRWSPTARRPSSWPAPGRTARKASRSGRPAGDPSTTSPCSAKGTPS
jgi:CHASE1-domain containing sensor protein